jgi:hypothetical protein
MVWSRHDGSGASDGFVGAGCARAPEANNNAAAATSKAPIVRSTGFTVLSLR